MVKILVKLLISAAVIFGIAYFSQGELLIADGWQAAALAALVLGLVNIFVKPIVKFFTVPLTIMTLGLFSIVINTLMLYIVSWLVPGIDTVGIFRTMIAAVIIAVITTIAYWFVDRD